jgi:hypothetical protein
LEFWDLELPRDAARDRYDKIRAKTRKERLIAEIAALYLAPLLHAHTVTA